MYTFHIKKEDKVTIKQEKQIAISELKKTVADLSIDIAKQLVKKELTSPAEHLKLVEAMLEDVTLN